MFYFIILLSEVNEMTLLDINQDRNILDELVITKFEMLSPLLNIIIKNEGINQNNLRKQSKFSGGKIYHGVKALKTMKLVENGNGLRTTELGKSFFTSFNSDKQAFKHVLITACLNVPMFNRIYERNKEIKDPKVLYGLFERELGDKYKNIDTKLIGSAVRRYMAGLHGIKIRMGAGIYPREKIKSLEFIKTTKDRNNNEVIEAIKSLKKSLRLSNEDIQQMINSLPKEKREEIFSNVFSKVFG